MSKLAQKGRAGPRGASTRGPTRPSTVASANPSLGRYVGTDGGGFAQLHRLNQQAAAQAIETLQRLAGNGAVARLIEEPKVTVQPQGGVPATSGPPPALGKGAANIAAPTAVLKFPDGPDRTALFGPGETEKEFAPELPGSSAEPLSREGSVHFGFSMHWLFQDMHEAAVGKVPIVGATSPNKPVRLQGSAQVEVTVPLILKTDPKAPAGLTLLQGRYGRLASQGTGGLLAGAPVTNDNTPDGGAVTVTPSLQFQEQIAQAEQVGYSISTTTPSTPFGIETWSFGGAVADQEQLAVNVNETFSRSYTVRVRFGKQATVPKESSFARTHFHVDSDTLENEEKLGQWYLGQSDDKGAGEDKGPDLSDSARCMIESGNAPIHITGYASATGSFSHNQKLARKRANKVKELINDLAGEGGGAKVVTKALGKYKAHGGERKEDRKAVIEVREIELAPDVKCAATSEGEEPEKNKKVPS